jgi:uncharacterized protein (DUF1330 family)
MAAYMIASFDVTDEEAYQAYVPGMMPVLMKYEPDILVADYEATAFEGECRRVNVVIRFASEQVLQAFYDDPDYRPWKDLRRRTTANGTLLVAKEFVFPA